MGDFYTEKRRATNMVALKVKEGKTFKEIHNILEDHFGRGKRFLIGVLSRLEEKGIEVPKDEEGNKSPDYS